MPSFFSLAPTPSLCLCPSPSLSHINIHIHTETHTSTHPLSATKSSLLSSSYTASAGKRRGEGLGMLLLAWVRRAVGCVVCACVHVRVGLEAYVCVRQGMYVCK